MQKNQDKAEEQPAIRSTKPLADIYFTHTIKQQIKHLTAQKTDMKFYNNTAHILVIVPIEQIKYRQLKYFKT